jgi:glycosyltransferase involved in cell wall biosynthesis
MRRAAPPVRRVEEVLWSYPERGSARPTLLEVCSYFGPYPGNFIPTLLAVRRAVDERLGLDSHFVFPAQMRDRPWVGLLEEEGARHSFLEPSHPARAVRRLLELARVSDAAIVRSHFSRWDLPAGAAARRRGAASVWHMHSGRFARVPTMRTRARDLVKARLLGGLCDVVVPVSDELHRLARARGFPERKLETVQNGIATSRFDHVPGRDEARRALGLDVSGPVALGFAWSPHTKGADVLVAAARELGEAGELTVVLVGDPSLLATVGEAPWLRVVGPRDDVATLFGAADVFVSASREEGFPYAIGEAMAAALPVVSSDIAGAAAYVPSPGVTTFPSEDASALRDALRRALQEPDLTRLGEANCEYVRDRLGLDRHVEQMLALFERLLSGRAAR